MHLGTRPLVSDKTVNLASHGAQTARLQATKMNDQRMSKINLVLSGLASAVALANCIATAETFVEDFASDPLARGWRAFGNTNLFSWNPTNQNLEVTWDSSQPNSYFYRVLDTILTLADEFELEFDLQLHDVEVGDDGFEIALGFINVEDATSPSFLRGTGVNSPNLFEFDYFPDVGAGASMTATMTDSKSELAFWWAVAPLESNVRYRARLSHPAGTTNIDAVILVDGHVYASLESSWVSPNFTDFRLNAISINSYSDEGGWGSIYARGTIDNLVIRTPPPPVTDLVCGFEGGAWQMQFQSQTNWVYSLERTQDLKTWADICASVVGTGSTLSLQDTNPPADRAFYRVRAYRP